MSLLVLYQWIYPEVIFPRPRGPLAARCCLVTSIAPSKMIFNMLAVFSAWDR